MKMHIRAHDNESSLQPLSYKKTPNYPEVFAILLYLGFISLCLSISTLKVLWLSPLKILSSIASNNITLILCHMFHFLYFSGLKASRKGFSLQRQLGMLIT